MEKLRQKVLDLLKSEFSGSEVQLDEPKEDERIFGYLIWDGFAELDQLDRQRQVWNLLRRELDREDQRSVLAILTVTPDELGVMQEG